MVARETTPAETANAIDHLLRRSLPAGTVVTINRRAPLGRLLGGAGPDRIILGRPDGLAAYVGPSDDLPALGGKELHCWYLPMR